MKITETQNTTISNYDRVTGTITIQIDDVPLADFIKYRTALREIAGFRRVGIDHTTIEERALIIKTELDHGKDLAVPQPPKAANYTAYAQSNQADVPSATTVAAVRPDKKPEKVKQPYLKREARDLLGTMKGWSATAIIKGFRDTFKNSKYTDSEIMMMFNRVQGIS